MADFRTHLTVSTALGAGLGAVAARPGGFEPGSAVLAAGLCSVAGMLPDLDSDSGRPVREVSGVAAALAPLLLLPRLAQTGSSQETTLACCGALYVAIRYGLAWAIRRASVHRGMFHSIPAALVAAMVVYLEYGTPDRGVRLLLGAGVFLGYLSHLALDEVYSVDLSGMMVRRTRSAGSALKWASPSWYGTSVCYGMLAGLALLCLEDARTEPGHWGALARWW